MPNQPRVFISSAHSDGETFATALRARLEAEEPEITLWQDRARMEGGKDWWRQITEALDGVQFMVLVMTPAALKSAVVRKEWQYARQRGVCVYPVIADDALDFKAMPRWMSRFAGRPFHVRVSRARPTCSSCRRWMPPTFRSTCSRWRPATI